jgi:hypothetical protein
MAQNIESVVYVKGKLRMNRKNANKFYWMNQHAIPEQCFLEDEDMDEDADAPKIITIANPLWCGEGSDWTFDVFKESLKYTTGKATLLVTWEGGFPTKHLRVVNGVVTEVKPKIKPI